MMSSKTAALALAACLMAAPAVAQQSSLGPVSATIKIEQVQVAFVGSGAAGGGTVTWRGRSYPITVGGLGVGGIGVSKLTATGSVYRLRNLDDLAGAYVQLRAGWAVGDQGKGRLWLENSKGVTLRLVTRRQGLQLALGADGVVIGFKR